MVYGVDLVKEQIRIAALEPLGFTQADLQPHGCAIEVRVNARILRTNFAGLPAPWGASSFPVPGRARRHASVLGFGRTAVLRFDGWRRSSSPDAPAIGDHADGTRSL